MTDNIVGYAVCVHGSKPRFFTGLMQGEPVLSTKGEDMHVFPTASAAEVHAAVGGGAHAPACGGYRGHGGGAD